jgi:hypothetical protein
MLNFSIWNSIIKLEWTQQSNSVEQIIFKKLSVARLLNEVLTCFANWPFTTSFRIAKDWPYAGPGECSRHFLRALHISYWNTVLRSVHRPTTCLLPFRVSDKIFGSNYNFMHAIYTTHPCLTWFDFFFNSIRNHFKLILGELWRFLTLNSKQNKENKWIIVSYHVF